MKKPLEYIMTSQAYELEKKISVVRMNITLNAICKFNLTIIKILMTLLTKMLKTIIKFICNNMRFWVAETIQGGELKAIMERLPYHISRYITELCQ